MWLFNSSKSAGSDAQACLERRRRGNILSVYERTSPTSAVKQTEAHLYGSSRLGMLLRNEPYSTTVSTFTDRPLARQAGDVRYELTDHLGNVRAVISDLLVDRPTGFGYATQDAEVMDRRDYYPFGMEMPGRRWRVTGEGAGRFGYNGKENDNEVKGEGNAIDFGARMYDARVGRFASTDPISRSYPDFSPYSYALNTPVQGKDADGNVVLFINGQHSGTGGTKAYWGSYASDVKSRLGDQSARYIDGALGGLSNTGEQAGKAALPGVFLTPIGCVTVTALSVATSSNMNHKVRIQAGRKQGLHDAADIIANLKDGETIKVVTHSMGTAFARGYTDGILEYAREHGLEGKVKFAYGLDVNAFQAEDLPADHNIKMSHYKLGGRDGGPSLGEWLQRPFTSLLRLMDSVPTVGPVPRSKDISTTDDKNKGHNIQRMSWKNIPTLGNGGDMRDIEQGSDNQGKP